MGFMVVVSKNFNIASYKSSHKRISRIRTFLSIGVYVYLRRRGTNILTVHLACAAGAAGGRDTRL